MKSILKRLEDLENVECAIEKIKVFYKDDSSEIMIWLDLYLRYVKEIMVEDNKAYFNKIRKIIFLHKIKNKSEPMQDTINIANYINKQNNLWYNVIEYFNDFLIEIN